MPRQRKVIVYVATSADGYIARPDGSVEWLNRRPHKYDYGMKRIAASVKTCVDAFEQGLASSEQDRRDGDYVSWPHRFVQPVAEIVQCGLAAATH